MEFKMKTFYIFPIVIFLALLSCKVETVTTPSVLSAFDSIPKDKYYSSELFNKDTLFIYNRWDLFKTSGGITMNGCYPDYNYIKIKPYGIFGIFRNDSLLSSGKITKSLYDKNGLLINLIFEKDIKLSLRFDPEKYLHILNHDTILFDSPCCDRYNFHHSRAK